MTDGFQFEIKALGECERLCEAWQDLEARAKPTYFLSWNWIGLWASASENKRYVVIGRRRGQIVLLGILVPSSRQEIPMFTVNGLRLHETGDPRLDEITIEYNGFLADQTCEVEVSREAIKFLLQGHVIEGKRRDEIHIKNAADSSLAMYSTCENVPSLISKKPSWRIDLDAIRASGRSYLEHLSANTRQQIRRSMRLYESTGKLELTRARDPAEGIQFLEELKTLHQTYWNGRGVAGAFANSFFETFQRQQIERRLSTEGVELLRVASGNKAIGYLYNFCYRGNILSYQSGFHYEDDAKFKPGLVSHLLCIEHHIARGDHVYDFMAGYSRYKANMAEPGPDMVYLIFQRSTLMLEFENGLRRMRQVMKKSFERVAPALTES